MDGADAEARTKALADRLRDDLHRTPEVERFRDLSDQLLTAHALEYALLGGLTSIFAVITGAAASWGIVRFVMGFDWTFEPVTAAVTVVFAAALTVIAGFAATWRALTAKVAPILRVD